MYFIDVQISLILCILFMYRFYVYIKPDQPDPILCILLMHRIYVYIKPDKPDLILFILLMYTHRNPNVYTAPCDLTC